MKAKVKAMTLAERGEYDEQFGKGKKLTWQDIGGMPKWIKPKKVSKRVVKNK